MVAKRSTCHPLASPNVLSRPTKQVCKAVVAVVAVHVVFWLLPLAALSVVSSLALGEGALVWMAEWLGLGVIATCASNVFVYAFKLEYARKGLRALVTCQKLQLHSGQQPQPLFRQRRALPATNHM